MTVELEDLTKGEVAGSGFFDELMRTSKAHLLEEYQAGRITGPDYANIYLGALQSNLSVAANFLLQYELTNQQVILLQEQVKQGQKQNELLELQKEQMRVNIDTAQYNLANLLPEQLQGAIQQRLLTTQQIENAKKQETLLVSQDAQVKAQTLLTTKQEDLVDEQILSERTNTSNPTGGLAKAQFDRAINEANFVAQKIITETAQTEGNETTVAGLVGKEMELKKTQADSFLRDAEQKAAKFYADVLSIAYSTDPTTVDPEAWNLGPTESFKVMNKVLTGIGVPL